MPRKKQEVPAPTPVAANKPSKESAKKSTKQAPKPTVPTKYKKHPKVDASVVVNALKGGKVLSKRDLVAVCGGDAVAVTRTLNVLRGEGKVVVRGATKTAAYFLAA